MAPTAYLRRETMGFTVRIERDVMLGFFAIRRLHESRKLAPGVIEQRVAVEFYPWRGHVVHLILRRDGELVPVRWRSMNDAVGQSHGALGEKRSLQRAFYEKLNRCKKQPDLIGQPDWSGIIAILDALRTAFADSFEPHLLAESR